MKKLIIFCVSFFAWSVFAGVFMEPVGQSGKVFRGRAPKPFEIKKMSAAGINSVLIFKNQTKDEVDQEKTQLFSQGFEESKIHHVPFLWKDIVSQQEACEQVIDALGIIIKVMQSQDDKILFHCTVGEDRTGLLAGLVTQLTEQEDVRTAYVNQMCLKGYAGGNVNKPKHVSEAVDLNLTPLYAKLSFFIQSGKLSKQKLSKKICAQIEVISFESGLQNCREIVSHQ